MKDDVGVAPVSHPLLTGNVNPKIHADTTCDKVDFKSLLVTGLGPQPRRSYSKAIIITDMCPDSPYFKMMLIITLHL